MKRLVLSLMVLSSLVFAGDKIQFNKPTIMCETKNAKFDTYNTLFYQVLDKEPSALENFKTVLKEHSKNDCFVVPVSGNVIANIIKKQKGSLNGVPYEYLYLDVKEYTGKNVSSKNIKFWTVSFIEYPTYKKLR